MVSIDPASAAIGSLQLLHALRQAPPIDRRGKGASVHYLGQVRIMTPYYAQPLRGSWYFPHALRSADKMPLVADRLLGALLAVRACGGPKVRAAAEQLVARVIELWELGTPPKRKDQQRQEDRLQQLLSEFGVAHRDFSLRRDLGYDRKLREHWWQFRRPRTAPEWPGGWPVEVNRRSR